MLDIERHYRTAHTAVCWFWCRCVFSRFSFVLACGQQEQRENEARKRAKETEDTREASKRKGRGRGEDARQKHRGRGREGGKGKRGEEDEEKQTEETTNEGREGKKGSRWQLAAVVAGGVAAEVEVRPVAIPLVVASPLADPQCHALGEDGDVATQRRRQLARHRDAKTSMGVGVGMGMGMGMGVVGVGVGMSVSMGMSMSMSMGVLTSHTSGKCRGTASGRRGGS